VKGSWAFLREAMKLRNRGFVVERSFFITNETIEWHTDPAWTAFMGEYPGPVFHGRTMPYMLAMATHQISNPMLFFVLMKIYNFTLQCCYSCNRLEACA